MFPRNSLPNKGNSRSQSLRFGASCSPLRISCLPPPVYVPKSFQKVTLETAGHQARNRGGKKEKMMSYNYPKVWVHLLAQYQISNPWVSPPFYISFLNPGGETLKLEINTSTFFINMPIQITCWYFARLTVHWKTIWRHCPFTKTKGKIKLVLCQMLQSIV